MPGVKWIVQPSQMFEMVTIAGQQNAEAVALSIARAYAPEIQQWLQANAPWSDRTGEARRGLTTEIEYVVGQVVRIWLNHGVWYGVYLEFAHAGRYQLLSPALDYFIPKIMADLQAELRLGALSAAVGRDVNASR